MKPTLSTSRTVALIVLLIFSAPVLAGGGKNETAATNWIFLINNPGACSETPCSESDLFDAWPENPTQMSACYLTGQSVQANGRATFAGRFAEGTNYGCLAIFGDPEPLAPLPLVDADTAEIHIVVQEHGPSRLTGAGLEEQLAFFAGACNPDCAETQFTFFVAAWGDTNGVWRFDGSPVEGGSATIYREEGGVRVVLHTRLDEDE